MSQDSSNQRRGRAGRVREGMCFRVYPSHMWPLLPVHTTPEILRSPLQSLCLQVKLLKLGDISDVLGQVGPNLLVVICCLSTSVSPLPVN